MRVRMHVCVYVYMYVCMYLCACVYLCVYVCMCMYMYVCMYVYVCMYLFFYIYGLLLAPLLCNSNNTSLLPNKYYLMNIVITLIVTIG